MTEAQQIAEKIRGSLQSMKSGSLRFWGHWFGRPYDNRHCVTGSDSDEDLLRIFFHEGETLSIWSPKGYVIYPDTFRINDANKIKWEWYYYGRPKTESNRYYMLFTKSSGGILYSTNEDWNEEDINHNPNEWAVEIL